VIAAGNPDEPGIGAEITSLISDLSIKRSNVWWIQDRLPLDQMRVLLTGADLFLCPSIYEPLGIVNLEAMACETAVLASRVGGIPEVVEEGVTGELVDYTGDTELFERAFAEAANSLLADSAKISAYGIAGRERAKREFDWERIADQTINLYQETIEKHRP
jgi:starch synthase